MPRWQPPSLSQPQNGYRFAIDAFLIAAFAARFRPQSWIDLGTGVGPIAHFLARALPGSAGVAVELQPELAVFAKQNLAKLKTLLIEGDLRCIPWRTSSFDLAVCNPPFFPAGSGRISPNRSRALAHHALFGDVVDFANSIRPALKPDATFCCILRLPDPHALENRLYQYGWHLHQAVDVMPSPNSRPHRKLCALKRQPQPAPETQALCLKNQSGEDSMALHQWLKPN